MRSLGHISLNVCNYHLILHITHVLVSVIVWCAKQTRLEDLDFLDEQGSVLFRRLRTECNSQINYCLRTEYNGQPHYYNTQLKAACADITRRAVLAYMLGGLC